MNHGVITATTEALIKCFQILCIRDIAEVDTAAIVVHDRADSDRIILHKFFADRQDIKLLNAYGGFCDAVAEQHIEFQFLLFADCQQIGNVERFKKRHHRITRFHP